MSERVIRRPTIIIALLLALAGCGSPHERAAKAVVRFEDAYAKRDMINARIEIRTAIAAEDDVAEYWNKLGRVELASGRYLAAYTAYARALELEKDNQEAVQAVAELSYSGGKPDDALKYADQMLAIQPRNLRMLYVKGAVAFDRKDVTEARRIADLMLSIDPSNEDGEILLTKSLFAAGDAAGAIKAIEAAIARDGESLPKLAALLNIYRAQNDFPALYAVYRRLFAIDPQSVPLALDYARELYEFGRVGGALAALDRLQRQHPTDDDVQTKIVDLLKTLGGQVVPIDQIRRFAATGSLGMKTALAQIAVDQGQAAEAVAILTPVVDRGPLTPGNVQAHVTYAAALAGLGRKEAAFDRANAALAFDRTNPQALLLRVRMLADRGTLDKALIDAQTLARDNPDMAAARIALARVYALRREPVMADTSFARGVDDLSDDVGLMQAYAAYMVAGGRRDAALELAKDFTRRNPMLLPGWKARAGLCLSLGDRPCLAQVDNAYGQLRGGQAERAGLAAAVKAMGTTGAPPPADTAKAPAGAAKATGRTRL